MEFFQAIEQLQAFLGDFSQVLASYHQALIKAGFNEEAAFVLVCEFQHTLFNAAMENR